MLGQPGTVARVRARSADGLRLHLEFRNGLISPFNSEQELNAEVGDIVLWIDDPNTGQRLDPAPPEMWDDEPWIGIVRLRRDDITVVDSSGRLRRVPTTDVDYSEGNTVEVAEFAGVIRVLHERPIRYLDLPPVDDAAVDKFQPRMDANPPTFADFGGLDSVVQRAKELIALPLDKRAELAAIGSRPIKGVLFTGGPGTGKTLLARIVAAESRAPFYEISGPEIFSKWYGQTPELLRRIFSRAEKHDKAIVFFDEIDSVAGRRGDETHEESKRVVAQLLTLLDGSTAGSNVIVIATTNRPEDIDPALRRPGRFDWEIHFPSPGTQDREAILRTWASKLATAPALPHGVIAGKSSGWSGADLAAIYSEAALLAVADNRSEIAIEDYVGGFERVEQQRQQIGRARLPRPTA